MEKNIEVLVMQNKIIFVEINIKKNNFKDLIMKSKNRIVS